MSRRTVALAVALLLTAGTALTVYALRPTDPAVQAGIPPPTRGAPRPPEQQAQALIAGAYPIGEWVLYLEESWGGTVTPRWSARQVTRTRWIAAVTLDGPADHSFHGRWTVLAPLGRDASPEEIEASLERDVPPEPIDDGGRRLSQEPPTGRPASFRGTVRLGGTLLMVAENHESLMVDLSGDPSGTTDADRRGRRLLPRQVMPTARVLIDDSTLYTSVARDGALGDLDLIAKDLADGPLPVALTWRIAGRQPTTLRELLQRPVSNVRRVRP